MTNGNIVFNSGDDDEMFNASVEARKTFKFLWRELSWENRRIIPGLDMYAVKVAFKNENAEGPSYEHMWVSELNFNGEALSGSLMNDPNWITSYKSGDLVSFQLGDISDWMYATGGRAYGGYTINLMRRRMSSGERKAHDKAWGLDFGDPNRIEIFYKPKKKKGIMAMFKNEPDIRDEDLMCEEHPMCINMESSLKEELQKSDEFLKYVDEDGNTMLHTESLAGNALLVRVLLDSGANPEAKNNYGKRPVDLAKALEWKNVLSVLET